MASIQASASQLWSFLKEGSRFYRRRLQALQIAWRLTARSARLCIGNV